MNESEQNLNSANVSDSVNVSDSANDSAASRDASGKELSESLKGFAEQMRQEREMWQKTMADMMAKLSQPQPQQPVPQQPEQEGQRGLGGSPMMTAPSFAKDMNDALSKEIKGYKKLDKKTMSHSERESQIDNNIWLYLTRKENKSLF